MSAALAEYRQRYRAARARLWGAAVRQEPVALTVRHVGPAWLYDEPIGPRRVVYAGSVFMPTTTTDIARRIVREVSLKHGVSREAMESETRATPAVMARQEAFYRLRHETSWGFARIGRFLGDRDHTTVMHAIKRHQYKLEA
jgi:hypothetical protein